MEVRAQVERLERARRRVDERVYSGALMECASKRTQLTTMVAEAEVLNDGMGQLKDCLVTMETRIGQIQAWTEAMEERMERGETYTDEVEVLPVYTAKEMLKAMTEEVASVTSASEGRAVTLETLVKGEYVSVSVAACVGPGGNDVACGRGTRTKDRLVLPGLMSSALAWDGEVDGKGAKWTRVMRSHVSAAYADGRCLDAKERRSERLQNQPGVFLGPKRLPTRRRSLGLGSRPGGSGCDGRRKM